MCNGRSLRVTDETQPVGWQLVVSTDVTSLTSSEGDLRRARTRPCWAQTSTCCRPCAPAPPETIVTSISNRDIGFRQTDHHPAAPGMAVLARREAIYLEQRFSDHAPLMIDYGFTL